MQPRERGAERREVLRPHAAGPDAFEEGADRRRAAAELPQRRAVPARDRRRAGLAVPRQVLHQPEEVGQLGRVHALLIERQDEVAAFGAQRVVGILDALRDAAEGEQPAEVVIAEEAAQRLVRDLGVDRHRLNPPRTWRGRA
jgi:hypothetical protein